MDFILAEGFSVVDDSFLNDFYCNIYATQAGNHAVVANDAAGTAKRINEQTMNYVNDKFWWGSVEEYNALESINPGTFYFINAKKTN